MRKLFYYSFIVLVIVFLSISCRKDDSIGSSTDEVMYLGIDTRDGLVLGKRLENPYSVANMRKAYELLVPETRSGGKAEDFIKATHRYIKFVPYDEEDLSLLQLDSSLILYPYPLDYEIVRYGRYHDPDVPVDQPTPLYCSVPVGNVLPAGVDYVVLDELFIPEEFEAVSTRSGGMSEDFLNSLVIKAFVLTGNIYDDCYLTRASGSKWVPQGHIKFWDKSRCSLRWENGRVVKDKVFFPVEGIEVRCRRWFTTYKAQTDANGFFKCKSNQTFSGKATCSLYFEKYDFEIRDGWLSTYTYEQPNVSGAWNLNIEDDLCRFYIDIFNAAYKFYYKDIHGLSRPPLNSFWKAKMRIRGHPYEGNSIGGDYDESRGFWGLGSDIHIYGGVYSLSFDDEIFSRVIHELAHAAHWSLSSSDFYYSDAFVRETWARGVEVLLTRDVYPDFSSIYYKLAYCGVVEDLIDGSLHPEGLEKKTQYYYDFDNSTSVLFDSPKKYIDKVSSYTLPMIERSLIGARNCEQWRDNLLRLYDNPTEKYLVETFDFWSNK